MRPVSPVFPNLTLHPPEVVYAKSQPEYQPLPSVREADGVVTARWHMTWRERVRVLFHGDVWCQIMTFGHDLQPSLLSVDAPELRRAVVSESDVIGEERKG